MLTEMSAVPSRGVSGTGTLSGAPICSPETKTHVEPAGQAELGVDPVALLDVSDQELAELQELAASQSKETLSLLFQLLFKGISEMQYSAHPRLVLEMAFVKAVQAGQVVPAASLLSRLDGLVKEGGGYSVVAPVEKD